jgi:hypothetical protein
MAVDTVEDHATDSGDPPSPGAGRYYSQRILRALLDVIELEAQIITLRLLSAMRDAVIRACLVIGGILLSLLGAVFLEIAIFQTLERFIPVVGVFLIFAVVHLLFAGILIFIAVRPTPTRGSRTGGTSETENHNGDPRQ